MEAGQAATAQDEVQMKPINKSPRYENPRLLKLAKGMPCQGCGCEDGSVVMAHSNFAIHGKAKGMKAHDCFTAALCQGCHTWLDSGSESVFYLGIWQPTREDKLEFFRRAMEATMLYLWCTGAIIVF